MFHHKRSLGGVFDTETIKFIVPYPLEVVRSFISRGAIAPTGARALC
jgi:hypothetical protein